MLGLNKLSLIEVRPTALPLLAFTALRHPYALER